MSQGVTISSGTSTTPTASDLIPMARPGDTVARYSTVGKLLDATFANVVAYGAAGDGVADDSTAVGDAMSSGKPVFFPQGTYLIGDVTASTDWIGLNATVHCTRVRPAAGVTIKDIDFVGRGATIMTIAGPDKVTVDGCSFTFDAGLTDFNAINTSASTEGLVVKNCKFYKGGIEMLQTTNFLITDNYFDMQSANTREPIHASLKSYGIISNNTILNTVTTDAIDIYSSGERSIVTGNRIIGIQYAAIECKVILNDTGDGSSSTYGYVESTIISNNIIRTIVPGGAGETAVIYGAYLDNRGSPSEPASTGQVGLIISENIIEDFINVVGDGYSHQVTGILYEGTNAVISGNVIRNLQSYDTARVNCGIQIAANTEATTANIAGVNVVDNVISTDGCGIRFGRTTHASNVKACNINGNIIRTDPRAAIYPRYGFYFGNTVDVQNCNFNSNIIDFTGKATYGTTFQFATATSVFAQNNICHNQIIGGYTLLQQAENCNIAFNKFPTAGLASAGTITIGVAGTVHNYNKVIGNEINAGTSYGIIMTEQRAFNCDQNTIVNSGYSILFQNNSTLGTCCQNISDHATAVTRYLTGAAAVTEDNNIAV